MTETVTAENDDNSDGWTTQEDPSTGKAYLYSRKTGEKTKWVDEEEDEGVEHSTLVHVVHIHLYTCNPIGWR
jgi:hypothetical protein